MARQIRFIAFVACLVLLAGCVQQGGHSSETPRDAAEAVAILALELGAFERLLDQAAEAAWDSSVNAVTLEMGREPTDEENTRGLAMMRGVLGEFFNVDSWKETVVGIYASHFSAAELDEIYDFYDSPTGRKTLELEGRLTHEVEDALDSVLEVRLDELITRIDEKFAEEFPDLAGEDG